LCLQSVDSTLQRPFFSSASFPLPPVIVSRPNPFIQDIFLCSVVSFARRVTDEAESSVSTFKVSSFHPVLCFPLFFLSFFLSLFLVDPITFHYPPCFFFLRYSVTGASKRFSIFLIIISLSCKESRSDALFCNPFPFPNLSCTAFLPLLDSRLLTIVDSLAHTHLGTGPWVFDGYFPFLLKFLTLFSPC